MPALLVALALQDARAENLSVYRCVGSDGHVRLQDRPCAADEQAQVRRVRRVGDSAPAATPPPTPTRTPEPAPRERQVEAGPPPLLWQCVDLEGRLRYEDRDRPNGRWVPAWVVGADPRVPPRMFGDEGRPAPRPPSDRPGGPRTQEVGVMGPMVWIEDRCHPLDEAASCAVYREQAEAAERTRRNRTGDEKRAAEAELQRLQAILDPHCRGY